MDLKVFAKQTDGASDISRKNFYGDGSTTVFTTPELGSVDGLRVFKNNYLTPRNTTDK